MEQWTEIHRRILVEKVSQRQVLRETGMHWKTLQKILEHSEPPGYTQVMEAVRELKQKGREVFVLLIHRPGEA